MIIPQSDIANPQGKLYRCLDRAEVLAAGKALIRAQAAQIAAADYLIEAQEVTLREFEAIFNELGL
jgi:hypothetical protein